MGNMREPYIMNALILNGMTSGVRLRPVQMEITSKESGAIVTQRPAKVPQWKKNAWPMQMSIQHSANPRNVCSLSNTRELYIMDALTLDGMTSGVLQRLLQMEITLMENGVWAV